MWPPKKILLHHSTQNAFKRMQISLVFAVHIRPGHIRRLFMWPGLMWPPYYLYVLEHFELNGV